MMTLIGSVNFYDLIGVFLMLAGFIIGLGAVTVIDLHGFLGIRSVYWTETTIRAHKVTKPLIWIGIILAIVGGAFLYRDVAFVGIPRLHAMFAVALILNGCFLSFYVSPRLLALERAGKARQLLPTSLQIKIALSFIVSFVGWWLSVLLFAIYLLSK